ncbi:MAG TPA: tetratricopeptide repeat protein [Roseiflexaceae bacterium]|nr:tetratricopeptide repeat protein [Roseiflexaceae bacterium]
MQNTEIARLLYDGAVAVREGRLEQARELLLRVIDLDETQELAWLWLSGAVEDPADQQVALENVLALNPHNPAATEGLRYLAAQSRPVAPPPLPTTAGGEWVPPPPLDDDEALELTCWKCHATLYSVAAFCWQCNAPVHACNNCVFTNEIRCKELQGLLNPVTHTAQNECPWWRPARS